MKYAILSVVALLICFVIGFSITHLLKNKIKKKPIRRLLGFFISLALMVGVVLIYCMDYYHAESSALEAIKGNNEVKVTKIKGGYYFDGPGDNERAMIFYPGAKVEAESYSTLLLSIAENGEDCFLASMPLNMAILNTNAADEFIENYDYENWDIMGHSMGGMVASNYAVANQDKIDTIIFLAAYPTKNIDDSQKVISIYGDKDKVLGADAYKEATKKFPKNAKEYIIEGGNHSQMGDYGHQSGDGNAMIEKEEQWKQIVKIICDNIISK